MQPANKLEPKQEEEKKILPKGEILSDYVSGNYTYSELAEKYNCSTSRIGAIIKSKTSAESELKLTDELVKLMQKIQQKGDDSTDRIIRFAFDYVGIKFKP